MDDIGNIINKSLNERDFTKGNQMMKLAEDATTYQKEVKDIIEFLDIEGNELTFKDRGTKQDELIVKEKPDYEAHKVNSKIEYSLYENFTHIRPFGFKISVEEIIEVKTWKEMLVRVCEILIDIDENKFISFEDNPNMNGRKRKHFSTTKEGMTEPQSILGKSFVETNLSSNGVRNAIVKMLKEFKINPKKFKIYFLYDYNELNR